MSINNRQLREIVVDVLTQVDLYSEAAVELLMLTAAQESHLGTYLKQVGNGPALGIFQMEPATEQDIINNYIFYRPYLLNGWNNYVTMKGNDLRDNIAYQIVMTRLHYLRVSEELPEAKDVEGLASYWKRYYNTELGKGEVSEAIDNYRRLCKR